MPRTTFRSALRLLLIGVIAIGLVFSSSPTAMAIGFAGDKFITVEYDFPEWQDPPVIQVEDGDEIEFELTYIDGQIDGYTNRGIADAPDHLHVRGYVVTDKNGLVVPINNNLVGPTIRVSPGDSFTINVINHLPDCHEPGAVCMSNKIDANQFNVTNLHTHGLHVSPDQDDVLAEIQPGENSQQVGDELGQPTYEYDIPANHPQGTFWYHPHVHQSTALQTSSGMSGALIIEGGLDNVAGIQGAEEKIFVFQQIPFVIGADGVGVVEDFDTTFGPGTWDDTAGTPSYVWSNPSSQQRPGGRTTINGQLIPTIPMNTGELQRWRFIHAGVRDSLNLIICPADAGSDCVSQDNAAEGETPLLIQNVFKEIAEDGIAFGYIREKSEITLHPGYRSDALVRIDTPGAYALVDDRISSLANSDSDYQSRKVLARIDVTGDEVNDPDWWETIDVSGLNPFDDIGPLTGPGQEVQFTVACVDLTTGDIVGTPGTVPELGYPEDQDAKHPCGGANGEYSNESTEFLVNGYSFNAEAGSPIESVVRDLTLGDTEEWQLSSLYNPHVFHIHINSFKIVGGPDDGVWKDTILVPAYQPYDPFDPLNPDDPNKTTITIHTRYEDFAGSFVIHCHILDHEDEGMMQIVRICPEGGCPELDPAKLHH